MTTRNGKPDPDRGAGAAGDGDESKDALLAAAARLPREIAPRRDLWPAVEAAIEGGAAPGGSPRHGRGLWLGAALAAGAALVAVLSLPALREQLSPQDSDGPAVAVADAPANGGAVGETGPLSSGSPAPGGLVPGSVAPAGFGEEPAAVLRPATFRYSEPGPGYLDARRELAAVLAERLDRLPPAERETLIANIATIRGALEQIDAALGGDPDNELLQQLLISTLQEEVAMLDNVNRATAPMKRRNEL